MDINLGQLNLTKEQMKRVHSLHGGKFKGGSQGNRGFVGVFESEPTDQEKQDLTNDLQNLSTDPLPKTRVEELKEKPVLTLPEIREILKLQGLA